MMDDYKTAGLDQNYFLSPLPSTGLQYFSVSYAVYRIFCPPSPTPTSELRIPERRD